MSVISGHFSWNDGLIWQVAFARGDVDAETSAPRVQALHVCQALVDTGAGRTCIGQSVVDALSLEPITRLQIQTAGGLTDADVFDVHLAIQLREAAAGSDCFRSTRGELIPTVRVVKFDPGRSPYQALIGRDVLRRGALHTSNDGHFSFAM